MGSSHSKKTGSSIMAEYTERQAQVAVNCCKLLANLKISLVRTFITKTEWICGCDITTDGKILLTDCLPNTCLIGIARDGKHLFALSNAPYEVVDVTCIKDTTVAITSGTHKVISIVDISSGTEKKQIDVGYNCWGVTHRDGTLLVCAERHGILSINLINEKITTIVQCDDLPCFSYITTFKDKLYYTDNETVTCCNMEGNKMWTFKDDDILPSPVAITTDNGGRVYVCDDVKNQVIVLSNDGKRSKTIITSADGLRSPYAIHFDKKRNNLLTANNKGRVFLFDVSS